MEPERRLLVAVDVERYSRQDNLAQHRTQETLQRVMAEACARLGLDRAAWRTQPSGDGELAVLPAGTPETTVVAHLADTLDVLLRQHNGDLLPQARVRLRVALHTGLVHLDGANGYPGAAAVTVCRLVDAAPVRRALADARSADVVQVVSDRVYEDVVAQRYRGLRPDRYTRVRIDQPEKGFTADAWLSVPGEPGRPAAAPAQPARPADGGGSSSTFTFGTLTVNGPAAFGDHSRATSILPEERQ
ncbi:hypothetical protein ACFFX1_17360 [Dactylosporangium sucinum]|uniref:Guanylate cyclase domain-containing protein n=1 Tax=Dactylosporangium sucinum TaxID=1424081 RepID=A0A917X2I5_9ACTN|nr:hypothetical protein [Dactylosporangium sucinum]GGM57350.1 hypothetical protein GCM10007977_068740 [Dactylosporangium sucinum]